MVARALLGGKGPVLLAGSGAGGQYKSQCVSEEKDPSTDAHTRPRASLTGGRSELAGVNSEGPSSEPSVNENVPSSCEAYFTSRLSLSGAGFTQRVGELTTTVTAYGLTRVRRHRLVSSGWAPRGRFLKVLQCVSLRYPARWSLKLLPGWW